MGVHFIILFLYVSEIFHNKRLKKKVKKIGKKGQNAKSQKPSEKSFKNKVVTSFISTGRSGC